MRIVLHLLIMVVTLIWGCGQKQNEKSVDSYKFSNENHLSNIKMLTDEGENAEAYFSPDGKKSFLLQIASIKNNETQTCLLPIGLIKLFSINIILDL